MEFVKMGDRLQTLIKWHTMDERPEGSGIYLVLWHTCCNTYEVETICYSKKYNLFGCGDHAKNAYEAISVSEKGIAGKKECNLVGWYKVDFTECFKKDGEF